MDNTTIWDKLFTPILGTNWRVTLSAIVSFIAFMAIYLSSAPGQAAFTALSLPQSFTDVIFSIVRYVMFLSALLAAYHAQTAAGFKFGVGERTGAHTTLLGQVRRNRNQGHTGLIVLQFVILLGIAYLIAKVSFGV